MLDTYKHKGQRKMMVRDLQAMGIYDEAVLEAMGREPRHFFVEGAFESEAYEDKALPIQSGQTISQPYTVAFQTQLLDLKPKMKVLEIGTGSGYQAAVLCEMGMRVFSVEYHRGLHQQAKKRLEELGYDAFLHCGDGSQGWQRYQPYQRILVTAASPDIPEPLKRQLDIGGRMVIPVGGRAVQVMTVVTRLSQSEYEIEKLNRFCFVPLVGKYGWEDS